MPLTLVPTAEAVGASVKLSSSWYCRHHKLHATPRLRHARYDDQCKNKIKDTIEAVAGKIYLMHCTTKFFFKFSKKEQALMQRRQNLVTLINDAPVQTRDCGLQADALVGSRSRCMDMWLRPVSESYCATCSVDAAKRLEMGDEGPRNGMWYSASGYSYHSYAYQPSFLASNSRRAHETRVLDVGPPLDDSLKLTFFFGRQGVNTYNDLRDFLALETRVENQIEGEAKRKTTASKRGGQLPASKKGKRRRV